MFGKAFNINISIRENDLSRNLLGEIEACMYKTGYHLLQIKCVNLHKCMHSEKQLFTIDRSILNC